MDQETSTIKKLTGGDKMFARSLYENNPDEPVFEFIFINYPPWILVPPKQKIP